MSWGDWQGNLMCGICGAVNFELGGQIGEKTILPMVNALRHRGPDDEGLFCDGDVALGHRRLSIIDLEGGHQPIFNENKSVCVIVNGEIYNYKELRKALEGEHLFSTQSDSEVIVHLWEDFGEKCVDHLRGMFAFALYDMNKKMVFLARDRFGQKPLVYADTPRGFYFCSEIYPLAQMALVDKTLSLEALDDFLSLHYIPAPNTVFRGIRKLPPGHCLSLTADGVKPKRYWAIDPFRRSEDSYERSVQAVFDLIETSVRYRMRADVPVGAFLSGGVDSSVIVAFMRRLVPEADIQTVCMGFEQRVYDEREYARAVARQLKTTHRERLVVPDVLQIMPRMVRHYGEPYGDASAIPTWYLSQVASDHVKVAMSGDGGDEIFGGYNRLDSTSLVALYQRLPAVVRSRLIEPSVVPLPSLSGGEGYMGQLQQFMKGASQYPAARFVLRNTVFSPEMKYRLYRGPLRSVGERYSPASRFFPLHEALRGLSETERLQFIDLGVFLPDDILAKVDIASMAHGLEVRSPFLDHELAEYVLSLPPTHRHRIFRRKRLLKTVGSRFFQASHLHRKKKGFRLPIGHWFRTSLRGALLSGLTESPIFAEGDLFDQRYIRRLYEEHQSGRVNHADRLWNLWLLGEWSTGANINGG